MHCRRTAGVLAAALACLALAAPSGARPRIVGGRPAPAGSWPSAVFLYSTFGDQHYGCTGSVVAPDWVVTAAHCAYGEHGALADGVTAILGVKSYIDPAHEAIAVDRLVVDPEYEPEHDVHDVAMLHLATPTTVSAMRLATPAEHRAGRYVSYTDVPNAAGWGMTDTKNTKTTTVLQEAYLRVQSSDECRAAVDGFDRRTQVCAGTENRAGACHGDSGGPLVAFDATTREPVLWGLTSYGPQEARGLEPCSLALPVVFSWVPAFADFIQSTVASVPAAPAPPPAPAPVPVPSGPVPPPPSAACLSARSTLATAKAAEKTALKRLRTLRRRHVSRKREASASERYHRLHARRLRISAAAGRACR